MNQIATEQQLRDFAASDKVVVRLYTRKELYEAERGFADMMEVIGPRIDAVLDSVEGKACKDGCAHCCKLRVESLPTEAARIVDYVREHLEPGVRQVILDKIHEHAELAAGTDARGYRDLDLRCALLGADDRCMVYDIRPISCRSFGSVNVSICDKTVEDDGESTFSAHPPEVKRLAATSGLFWSEFNGQMLDYWQGLPVRVEVMESSIKIVQAIRADLDSRKVVPDNVVETVPFRLKTLAGYPGSH